MSHSDATFDQKNVGHSNLFFHGLVILPYIVNSIWWMDGWMSYIWKMSTCWCNTTFDLRIYLGHSGYISRSSDFSSFIFCSEKQFFLMFEFYLFNWAIQASYAVQRQLLLALLVYTP